MNECMNEWRFADCDAAGVERVLGFGASWVTDFVLLRFSGSVTLDSINPEQKQTKNTQGQLIKKQRIKTSRLIVKWVCDIIYHIDFRMRILWILWFPKIHEFYEF